MFLISRSLIKYDNLFEVCSRGGELSAWQCALRTSYVKLALHRGVYLIINRLLERVHISPHGINLKRSIKFTGDTGG